MSRSFNFNHYAHRRDRPLRIVRTVECSPMLRIVGGSTTNRGLQSEPCSAGGTPSLDALLVSFVLRPDRSVQIADLAVSLGYAEDRLGRAIEILIASGAAVAGSDRITPQTWVRRS